MPLPGCGVLWPTNHADKGIEAVKKAAIDANIVDLTDETAKEWPAPHGAGSRPVGMWPLPLPNYAGAGALRAMQRLGASGTRAVSVNPPRTPLGPVPWRAFPHVRATQPAAR
jgi:hypothetical protein